MSLRGKTIFVTGGSRGIGLAIAKRAAKDGANVVIAAKTANPHPKLPGTIFTAAEECESIGGQALALQIDVRDERSVEEAFDRTIDRFGSIDILVNNASAIDNSETLRLSEKKYDLMHSINGRGTFFTSKIALPHLLETENPHVLNISPPLDMLRPAHKPIETKWFQLCGTGYTMSKVDMTLAMMGMAKEFEGRVSFSSLWPRTAIATSAIDMLAGENGLKASRTVDIMSDAAHWILTQDNSISGRCFLDEDVLVQELGRSEADIAAYRYDIESSGPLMPDFYVGDTSEYETFMTGFSPPSTPPAAAREEPPVPMESPANVNTERTLKDKTIFVTGGSRGIGLAIAKRAAKDGANVVIAAKTANPHPKLPGTIFTAAEECESLGGRALPLQLNVQDDEAVKDALAEAADRFGGIDVLVNNASAIDNSESLALSKKKYDLMHSINSRGTFMVSKFALPYLLKSENAHVLNLSPPLDLDPRWFQMAGTAYTMAKFNMSMSAVGMAAEYRGQIGFNCLWPRTSIATAAVDMLAGSLGMNASRTVDIMSDTAHWILTQDNKKITGNCFVDEDIALDPEMMALKKSDLEKYRVNKWMPFLIPDLYVGDPSSLESIYKTARTMSRVVSKGPAGLGSFFAGKSK